MKLRQRQMSGPGSVNVQAGGNVRHTRWVDESRYTSDVVFDMIRTAPANERTGWQLPPGGWLSAILVRKLSFPHEDLTFVLYGYDRVMIFAEFTVDQLLNCGGTMLAAPIPNVNAAHPYVLTIPAGSPALEITTVNCRMR